MTNVRTYADKTKTPVDVTISDIRNVVTKHGGKQFVFGVAEDKILIGFIKDDRKVHIQVGQSPQHEQRNKSLARALLLVIKAKLEAVAAGVSVFEEEFLANIVLPDNTLVGTQARVAIAAAYDGRDMPPLLPDYSA